MYGDPLSRSFSRSASDFGRPWLSSAGRVYDMAEVGIHQPVRTLPDLSSIRKRVLHSRLAGRMDASRQRQDAAQGAAG